jgi:hypothetical protein
MWDYHPNLLPPAHSIPAARSKVQVAALQWKDGAVTASNSVN